MAKKITIEVIVSDGKRVEKQTHTVDNEEDLYFFCHESDWAWRVGNSVAKLLGKVMPDK